MFCRDNVLVRQKSIFDLTTGQEMAGVDSFTESKVRHSPILVTPRTGHLVVGERGRTKLYQFKNRRLLMTYPPIDRSPLSPVTAFACPSDGRRLYLASENGDFRVLDIEPGSPRFGESVREYRPRADLVNVQGTAWCHVVSDIAVSPKNDACVALNVNNRQLIIYNVDFDNETEMAMHSLLANTPADDKSILFG